MSSILIRRANVVYSGGRLPSGYTELAYLQSDGRAFINSGVKVYECDRVRAKASFSTLSSSTNQYLVGSRVGSATSGTAIAFGIYHSDHGGLTYYKASWPDNAVGVAIAANQVFTYDAVIGTSSQSFTVDGTLKDTGSASISKGSGSNTLGIFCMFAGGSSRYNQSGTRIYFCEMWLGSTKVMELVPAMRNSDSVVGMYDLVGNQFLTNAGSGSFSYGIYKKKVRYSKTLFGSIRRKLW